MRLFNLALALFLVVIIQSWAGFSYYTPVTINPGQVPSTQTDFPILVSVTDARLKTVANGGHVKDAQGDDIRPYTDTLTTAITGYQKVFYDGVNGILEMWVKRSSVSDGLVTYLAYGDATLTTDASSSTTWSNGYHRGFHLADGTTLSLVDSVLGFNVSNVNSATATAGQIDGGVGLASASSQYLSNGSSNNPSGTAFTISAWVKATSFPGTYNGVAQIGTNAGIYKKLTVKSNGKLACFLLASSAVSYDGTGSTTLSTGTWYYLTMTYDSSAGLIGYVNASQDGTASANGNANGGSCCNFSIGNDVDGASRYWNGVIDEVRMSTVARSANWITTEYNNQSAPSTFETFGTEVIVSVGMNSAKNFFFSD